MNSKYPATARWLLITLVMMSDIAYGATCIGSGASRVEATLQTTQQCGTQIGDCDLHNNRWYCSNNEISKQDIEIWLRDSKSDQSEDLDLDIDIECIDPDGDGWGWDGKNSCRASVDTSRVENRSNHSDSNSDINIQCKDPDGDGWGWDGTNSCRTAISTNSQTATTNLQPTSTTNECMDPDGDGWGWDGTASCRSATATQNSQTQNSQTQNISTTTNNCTGNYGPSDITDLILATGQSNLIGAETTVSASLDRFGKVIEFYNPDKPHPRVFAWTVDPHNYNYGTGWKVAELNQTWHDSSPGVGGIARNNFAFHFAKQLASQPGCRVVGFVMVSEGGRGISHWDQNATGWREVNRHVNDAMAAIDRTSIDGILWHQGESDWITDGTCFTTDTCRTGQPDYYPQKLYSKIADTSIPNYIGQNALIDRLRRQSWFSDGKPFIAGETVKAPVNIHLNKLNTDNDKWTACVVGNRASGIGVRADDPFKNHYNAAGLREMGARYAQAYIKMKQ